MSLQPVKGARDILPEDYQVFLHIIDLARNLGKNYGYQSFDIPIFEYTEIFSRSLGNTSEIVKKEMYSFLDRKNRSLTLRPEFTAGVVRSVLSNGLQNKLPIKLFINGPLFRYERPQKGRNRQFYQVNFENIGYCDPIIDTELIALGDALIRELNLSKVTLELNSLGDQITRENYTKSLVEYLENYREDLSEDSQMRLAKNPLRILDSKDEGDRKILEAAPIITDFLTKESRMFFDSLLVNLDSLKINYKINSKLVRGLDYYTGTVFEFTTSELGAQNALMAGGRYDSLFKQMGNHEIPAIGFAAGIERLMELYRGNILKPRIVTIIALEKELQINALHLAQTVRNMDIPAEIQYGSNISKLMKKALVNNTKYLVFIGSDEVKQNKFKVKDLDAHQESLMTLDEFVKLISISKV